MVFRQILAFKRNQNILKKISAWYNPIYSSQIHGKMERVAVRCVEGDEFLTLSFVYGNKHSNLLRPKTEVLEKSLERIKANITKLTRKGNRKNKKTKLDPQSSQQSEEIEVKCSLLKNGLEVDKTKMNKDAWIEGAVLQIQERSYEVCKNVPSVLSLKLPNRFMVGCAVSPRVEVEFANLENSSFVWYQTQLRRSLGNRGLNSGSTNQADSNQSNNNEVAMATDCSAMETEPAATIKAIECQWTEICRERVLTPTEGMVGSKLKLECVPSNGARQGIPKEVVSASQVTTSPGVFPFEKRQVFTKGKAADGSFRVVCYNILADLYADSDFSRDTLYPYCPADVLDIDYREQILLKELTGYNCDIMCLQEVGKKLFQQCLQPFLMNSGFEGLLQCKHKQVPEGEAIFYNTDKFKLVEEHNIILSEELEKPYNNDLLEGISHSSAMLKRFQDQATICQVVVFEHIAQPTQKLCIANTHLYFHPRAAHIRLVQTAIMIRHIEELQKSYRAEGKGDLSVMVCGDLNSQPAAAAYKYLANKTIPHNSVDWYTSGKQEFCGGIPLQHSLDLTDACKDIEYTNFVAGFHGKLDHVFIQSPQLGLEFMVPMSTHDEVTQYVALPNKVFPSDHMALVCDIRWQ